MELNTIIETLKLNKKEKNIIVLASRPAMGKSSLAMKIAVSFIQSEKKAVGYFSLEMSEENFNKRLTTISDKGVMESLHDKLYVIDDSDSDQLELITSIKEINGKDQLGLVVIDYIQLMRCYFCDKKLEVIMSELVLISHELNLPILILSQLNRGVEGRDEKRPQISDLDESRELVDFSDTVMFLYRDNYYGHENSQYSQAELIIAKSEGYSHTIKFELF
ncbi:replicative DNA helicase domain protein [Bacteriovorax sp. BSW11_IV]|uniref:DnaB-like helicase C-terminal domain-containing protein n=1 Tax=Bacteriovorax sp. BSW11_IV TaxID=1353529 RepID=UPI00038A3516|nr:DnaB-like helicase C-terminal domain-containing protein [Bacteriovorax sp. BSW11_IV]EQC45190.1 replicative DNA helicase domain protein [Bacteriovorax sp. BSW11_IV]